MIQAAMAVTLKFLVVDTHRPSRHDDRIVIGAPPWRKPPISLFDAVTREDGGQNRQNGEQNGSIPE
jgi:hypothetical protein